MPRICAPLRPPACPPGLPRRQPDIYRQLPIIVHNTWQHPRIITTETRVLPLQMTPYRLLAAHPSASSVRVYQ